MLALAGPVTVNSSTTAPLRTTTGDGQGPGNITVETNGTITVSSGVPLTLDSDNDVVMNGTLRNDAESGATGLLVNTSDGAGGGRTLIGNLTLGGLINIPGPSNATTTASNNVGILFTGPGTLQGNYSAAAGSQISVGGLNAVAISMGSNITGTFTSGSSITLAGGGGIGVRSTGTVGGDFSITGNIQATGQDSIGALIGGNVGGLINFTSSMATGQQAFFDSNNRRVDAVFGGPALWVAGSSAKGVLLQGNQLTSAQEATTPIPTDAPIDSVLATEGTNFGTFRISPNSTTGSNDLNIGLRDDGSGDSVTMRGRIQTSTSTLGKAVTAVAIAGGTNANGGVIRTIIAGGVRNLGGNIDAASVDGTATGFDINNFATVPYIFNSGDVSVQATDSGESIIGGITTGGGNATGISVDANSSLLSFINTGSFTTNARGANFTATGLLDNAGTVTYFENTGTFQAIIRSGSTGQAIAANLSKSQSNIDFRNSGTMIGSVTLGSGNDSFRSTGGSFTGNLSMGSGNNAVAIRGTTFAGLIDLGAGNHTVTIDGGAKVSGGIQRGAGTSTLNINSSDISIIGGRRIEATNAYFSGTTTVDIGIDGQNISRPLIDVTGQFTVDSSVKIATRLSGLVTQSETVTVISAGDLRLGIPIADLGTGASSYIYGSQFRLNPNNPNQVLLDVTRRTAAQLGLAQNLGTVYETSLTAMAKDSELFSAIAATNDRASFEGIVGQLMPDSSDASLYAALRSQNLAYGVIRNRLGGIARTTGPSRGTDFSSFWVQQLGSYGKRDADVATEQPGYDIYTVGIATGFDQQFTPDLKAGMSVSQVWSLPDESSGNDRPMRIATTQVDFYGRHQNGPNFTQAIFGGSYNAYRSERRVEVGTIERQALGRWKGYNVGAAVDTGTQLRFSDLRLTPYVRGSYMRAKENSYTETDGGDGVNLAYDGRTQDSLRAGAGFVAETRFVILQDVGIETALRGDISRELSADPANVTARFAAGGASFTQVGQKLDKNIFGAGVSLGVRDIFTAFSIDYDAEKSGDFLGHTLAATFRFRF